MSKHEISDAAVKAVLEVLWETEVRACDVRAALEAAAPILLAEVERELSDATRTIALLVSDAGGKVTLSRKAVAELASETILETTQDVINGGWVIRTKATR